MKKPSHIAWINSFSLNMLCTSLLKQFCKVVVLKTSWNSPESTCGGISFLINLQTFRNFENISGTADPVDTGRELYVHKTLRRRPGRLLNVLCTFSLRSVPTANFHNTSTDYCFFTYNFFLHLYLANTAGFSKYVWPFFNIMHEALIL